MKARKLLALLMAILCLPVLSAQASPTSDALVIGIQSSKTTSLNPLFPVERDMLSIFDLMYDSLITIDDNYQPQAGLAESWTQTGNGRTWTFTLRQGVLFSDGTEMTANDVVATANYIISCAKDTNLTNKGYYANLRYFVKEIKARDNYTVEVRADRQYYGVLYAMTFPVLPASALESANPPGTGAYMITAFTPYSNGTKGSMTLSLNPYYSGKPPQFKNLYFDLYGKDADVVNAYQYSNVDAIFSRSLSIAQYKSSTNTLAITYRTNQLECLLLNNYLGSMTNNMRTAIRSCINIDSIVQSVYMSMVDRTNTPMIQGTWMYNSNLSSYFQVDLNKARQLLEEDGWYDTDGSGYVDKPNKNNEAADLTYNIITYEERARAGGEHDCRHAGANRHQGDGGDGVVQHDAGTPESGQFPHCAGFLRHGRLPRPWLSADERQHLQLRRLPLKDDGCAVQEAAHAGHAGGLPIRAVRHSGAVCEGLPVYLPVLPRRHGADAADVHHHPRCARGASAGWDRIVLRLIDSCFLRRRSCFMRRDFASAEARRGLSDRPLHPFGCTLP